MGRLLYKSILMPDNAVFIVKAIVRAGIIRSLKKASHFIFIKINHAGVAVVVVIVDVISTGITVGRGLLLHLNILHRKRGNGIKAFVRRDSGKKIIASLTGYHRTVIAAELFLRHIELESLFFAGC